MGADARGSPPKSADSGDRHVGRGAIGQPSERDCARTARRGQSPPHRVGDGRQAGPWRLGGEDDLYGEVGRDGSEGLRGPMPGVDGAHIVLAQLLPPGAPTRSDAWGSRSSLATCPDAF